MKKQIVLINLFAALGFVTGCAPALTVPSIPDLRVRTDEPSYWYVDGAQG